jgi:hypothetical protein
MLAGVLMVAVSVTGGRAQTRGQRVWQRCAGACGHDYYYCCHAPAQYQNWHMPLAVAMGGEHSSAGLETCDLCTWLATLSWVVAAQVVIVICQRGLFAYIRRGLVVPYVLSQSASVP